MTARPWYTFNGLLCRALYYLARWLPPKALQARMGAAFLYGMLDIYGVKSTVHQLNRLRKVKPHGNGKNGQVPRVRQRR